MWKLLKRNPNTNTEVWFQEQENGDVKIHQCMISESPALAVYQYNAKQRDSHRSYGDGKVAARIDAFTMNKLMIEGAAKDGDYMRKFLNMPSNKHMRTTTGKI